MIFFIGVVAAIHFFKGYIKQIFFDSRYLLIPATFLMTLSAVYLTTLISAIHPLKQCICFCHIKNGNHPFFEVYRAVFISFTTCSHSLSLIVICCHPLALVVPLAVIRCTTRCHLFYHLLSFVVTRCITRLSFYKRSNLYTN